MIPLEASEPGGFFASPKLVYPSADDFRAVLDMACVDSEGPAMGAQLLDIKECQAVASEDLLRGQEGEIAEVFVIDRIELILFHQPHQMRKLDGDDTTRPKQDLHSGDEVVQIGHLCKYVV